MDQRVTVTFSEYQSRMGALRHERAEMRARNPGKKPGEFPEEDFRRWEEVEREMDALQRLPSPVDSLAA